MNTIAYDEGLSPSLVYFSNFPLAVFITLIACYSIYTLMLILSKRIKERQNEALNQLINRAALNNDNSIEVGCMRGL